MLTLEPADIIHLDFVLHTRTAILHEVIQNDKLPIVAAPNILSDIVLSILGLPVFNASNNKLTVQPGTLLFSLAFTKVHSILAIHDDEPKIVRKTLQEKNILNSVLLQTLSSLMSRLATTLDMEERIQAAEALQSISVQTSESEKYQTRSSSDGQLPVTFTPTSQLTDKTILDTKRRYDIFVVPFVFFNLSKGKAQKFNQNFLVHICLADLQR